MKGKLQGIFVAFFNYPDIGDIAITARSKSLCDLIRQTVFPYGNVEKIKVCYFIDCA